MESIYTQEQINEAWGEYRSKRVYKILQDGETVIRAFNSTKRMDGTSAEIIKLHTVQSFPKYLSLHYGQG